MLLLENNEYATPYFLLFLLTAQPQMFYSLLWLNGTFILGGCLNCVQVWSNKSELSCSSEKMRHFFFFFQLIGVNIMVVIMGQS